LGKFLFKLFFLLTLFFFQRSSSFAQTNLIRNGSFEKIDSCYGGTASIGFDVFEWSGCEGWSNPIASSSDLWCSNPVGPGQVPPFVPYGYQFPRTGDNMAAILINGGTIFNYREYIENQLVQSLKNGYTYDISLYISSSVIECSPVEIGVKFFNQKFYDSSKLWLTDLIPDAVNDYHNFVVDTAGWQKVSFNYAANGTENYVVIGNFEDSLHIKYNLPCDTSYWGNLRLAGNYFLIDDVSIIELPYTEPQIPDSQFPTVFTPNNDGVNDNWFVNLNGYHNIRCCIFNRWGIMIFDSSNKEIEWDGRATNGEMLNDGVYYYMLEATTNKEEKINLKGFIQLIR
jgi:gliding motility-associated-like protein